ncbi:MAG: SPFH domain-containing protein [Mobiluncus porci]|uniref:SPFH domain-containing protein n=1 Tax=Mobiluncus porci TaxID=2652278 RepID=UPI0023F3DB76|nr:SPFH domain-containing protein [Mobiluncus porci]MDD7541896.1 SPFH domain-containing protein [Mobiluncus porci]MDY5749366.1 SPFH domain-containing protein [Mobiluncus porci]
MEALVTLAGGMMSFIIGLIVVLLIIFLATGSIYVVKQQTNYIIERFGKFHKVALPGLRIKIPIVDRIAKKVPLRIMQLDSVVETKTKDNVFVTIPVSVQYQVQSVADSYYRLANPERQIQSYVYDRVRTSLAKLDLDDAFSSKDQIAQDVETTLSAAMNAYGFAIINTLVTDINPDPTVRASMNSINAAQREREAAISLAEAEKIKIVKQAEADAEYKRLQGEGIAAQRKAIVDGLVEQYESLRDAGIGAEAQEMLLLTQYFDTLQEVAKASNTQTLMLPSNPGGVNDAMTELRNSLFTAVKAGEQRPAPAPEPRAMRPQQ